MSQGQSGHPIQNQNSGKQFGQLAQERKKVTENAAQLNSSFDEVDKNILKKVQEVQLMNNRGEASKTTNLNIEKQLNKEKQEQQTKMEEKIQSHAMSEEHLENRAIEMRDLSKENSLQKAEPSKEDSFENIEQHSQKVEPSKKDSLENKEHRPQKFEPSKEDFLENKELLEKQLKDKDSLEEKHVILERSQTRQQGNSESLQTMKQNHFKTEDFSVLQNKHAEKLSSLAKQYDKIIQGLKKKHQNDLMVLRNQYAYDKTLFDAKMKMLNNIDEIVTKSSEQLLKSQIEGKENAKFVEFQRQLIRKQQIIKQNSGQIKLKEEINHQQSLQLTRKNNEVKNQKIQIQKLEALVNNCSINCKDREKKLNQQIQKAKITIRINQNKFKNQLEQKTKQINELKKQIDNNNKIIIKRQETQQILLQIKEKLQDDKAILQSTVEAWKDYPQLYKQKHDQLVQLTKKYNQCSPQNFQIRISSTIKKNQIIFDNLCSQLKQNNKKMLYRQKESIKQNEEKIWKPQLKLLESQKSFLEQEKTRIIQNLRQQKNKIQQKYDSLEKNSQGTIKKLKQKQDILQVRLKSFESLLSQLRKLLMKENAIRYEKQIEFQTVPEKIKMLIENINSKAKNEEDLKIGLAMKYKDLNQDCEIIKNWSEWTSKISKTMEDMPEMKNLKLTSTIAASLRQQTINMHKAYKRQIINWKAKIQKQTMQIEKAKDQEKEWQKNILNANTIKDETVKKLQKALQDKLNFELQIKKKQNQWLQKSNKKQSDHQNDLIKKDEELVEIKRQLYQKEGGLQSKIAEIKSLEYSFEIQKQQWEEKLKDIVKEKEYLQKKCNNQDEQIKKINLKLKELKETVKTLNQKVQQVQSQNKTLAENMECMKQQFSQKQKLLKKQFDQTFSNELQKLNKSLKAAYGSQPSTLTFSSINAFISDNIAGLFNCAFVVSQILQQLPKERAFLHSECCKFQNSKISSQLLIKYDEYNKNFTNYLPNDNKKFTFVLIVKTKKSNVFAVIARGLGMNSVASVINLNGKAVMKKNERSRVVSAKIDSNILKFGNQEITFKNNSQEISVNTTMFGDKYFNFKREELLSNEGGNPIPLEAIEIHRVYNI